MNLTEILKKYDRYLELNYKSEDTKSNYLRCLDKFLSDNTRVYRMSNNEIKTYFIEFNKRYSTSYYNQMLSSLMILYNEILNQKGKLKGIQFLKDHPKQVVILSKDELTNSLQNILNIKHKCIIKLTYIGALRISELQNIKLKDINSDSNRISINTAKGGRTRSVPISNEDLELLRTYYKKHKPKVYLFEGNKEGVKYSKTSIRNVILKIKTKKKVYPHLIRHTALTNLVDKGHSSIKVQTFSGHQSTKSLQRYYHLSESALSDMTLTL